MTRRPIKQTISDEALARGVRGVIDELQRAVKLARDAGLSVQLQLDGGDLSEEDFTLDAYIRRDL